MTYCEFVRSGKAHPVHLYYHDHVYGFPVESDDALFERLVLEINQAGLSWETILKKQDGFRAAYDGFVIARVAAYGESDIARLLADPGIIRNRLKVRAAVTNAQKILELQATHGSFKAWLDSHHSVPQQDKAAWVALFKKTFTFTGGEIVGEFLMSCAYLPGAHDLDCPQRTKA
ncbi:DNA-3-methyladenine glycosylase I [Armatimonas sp.]|uniref:DNA-3-methyladenine glycosylase I n=1 Tax=Armatimonas sp. TaxID=1872638 RepID=UPI003751C9E1